MADKGGLETDTTRLLARVPEIPSSVGARVSKEPKATSLVQIRPAPSVSGGTMSESEKNQARSDAMNNVFGS